jgi:hypothetical protein
MHPRQRGRSTDVDRVLKILTNLGPMTSCTRGRSGAGIPQKSGFSGSKTWLTATVLLPWQVKQFEPVPELLSAPC